MRADYAVVLGPKGSPRFSDHADKDSIILYYDYNKEGILKEKFLTGNI